MKLDVTRRSDLAVRTLLALDGVGDRVKGSDLAELVSSTPGFLPQVLAPLVQRRWVRSDPGPTGGYVLLVDLGSISVLDVIEAIEGPTDLEMCVLDGRLCDDLGRCAIHDAWSRARETLVEELGATSLEQIREHPPRGFPSW
ncbi:MAG: Rrf2 family transcriptional regulator [Actinomycetia bacterium]|nr:Rrf2 family transcriptional regulator [Actinomycetes bacterium]MCP4087286.1 Rrf2 family transcriptional regulator [Actinomycetes bacterium]